MPQVDIVSFGSQNLWVVLSFLIMTTTLTLYYLLFNGIALNIGEYYKQSYATANDKYNVGLIKNTTIFGLSFLIITKLYLIKVESLLVDFKNYLNIKYSFTSVNALYLNNFNALKSIISF